MIMLHKMLWMGAIAGAMLVVGCSEPSMQRVEITLENKPPLAVTVSGAGITIPAGIAIAVVVTPVVEGKQTTDSVTVACGGACDAIDGTEPNEMFILGVKPGTDSLFISSTDHGSIRVPITVTEQVF
jgi:hypothetical protein